MNGDSPVDVLTNQIIKYQFPSSFSIGRGVKVASRFKIRPFRFLLKLLDDSRIQNLSEDEIAKIIVTEAENESEKCYEHVVERLLQYRNYGDKCLESDFLIKYQSSKGGINLEHPYSHLIDLANTLVNWLEYTQLVKRIDGKVFILDERKEQVKEIINQHIPFIDRPNDQEYFQRKYGIDPKHRKDNRDLNKSMTITPMIIARQKVMQAFITESLNTPITSVTTGLVDRIVNTTGIDGKTVEEILIETYPRGAVGAFMTKYFEMAFKGRDEAVEFEKATTELFRVVFGFQTKHVGPIGLTPDVLLVSRSDEYQAIIDNKAYSRYSINNDHHNRMVHNYIANIDRYSGSLYPLKFYAYIAGGFGANINKQLYEVYSDTNIPGAAVSVSNVIKMVEKQSIEPYSHGKIKDIFSLNRQVLLGDL